MLFRRTGARSRWSIAIATAIYALVLAGSAFEHHDILCELRNPQHCGACTATPLGSDPQTTVATGTSDLADVGRAITRYAMADDALLPVRSTGRSPPPAI